MSILQRIYGYLIDTTPVTVSSLGMQSINRRQFIATSALADLSFLAPLATPR